MTGSSVSAVRAGQLGTGRTRNALLSSSTCTSVTPAASVQEHQRVFSYRPKTSGGNANRAKSRARLQTATLKFICLSDTGSSRPPATVAEKAVLANAGLGPASITFDLNGDYVHLHNKLLEQYPDLVKAGGYELLLYQRSGLNQGFHKIEGSLTPRRLKDLVHQAQIFIRPLQRAITRYSTIFILFTFAITM